MPLSDDQKAMLRLLAQREEGYADIAALKGMTVEEVRSQVRAALDELAAEPRPPAPEPVVPKPPPPPPVKPPAPSREAPPAQSGSASPRPGRRGPSVPPERRRVLALAGGAVGVVAVVLAVLAITGRDSGSAPSGEGSASEAAVQGQGLTQAVLKPVGGGDASGQAVFGRVGKEEVALQVAAQNLEPATGKQSYTVWLYRSPKLALRVGSVKVGNSGQLGARFPIPAELLAYVASGAFKQIYISRTDDASYEAELKRARKQKTLPRYSGETALRGKITGPIVKQ